MKTVEVAVRRNIGSDEMVKREVPCIAKRGCLAITPYQRWGGESATDLFTITHIPTGMAVEQPMDKKEARRMLRALAALDWSRPKTKAFQKKAIAVIRQVRGW